MRLHALLPVLLALAVSGRALAQPADCNRPAAEVVSQVTLPGHPFSAIPTADGCTLFVSLTPVQRGDTSQIAVLSRSAGRLSMVRTVAAGARVAGMTLSPDGKVLAVGDIDGVMLFDVAKLISGADARMAASNEGKDSGGFYVAFSPDGRLLAFSNETANTITIYDFTAFLGGKPFRAAGKIPVALGPTGLAFSPDGKRLYASVQMARGTGYDCPPENGKGPGHPPGVLTVIDADRAAANPGHAVLAEIPAGCNPVRVALSPDGERAYVSARGGNVVAMFETATLLSSRGHALAGIFKVGKAPVGLTADAGRVFVANSDRFGGGQSQTVYAIDPSDPGHAKSIPVGGFPRELKLTADGKTLLVTNFGSNTLELVDLERALAPVAR